MAKDENKLTKTNKLDVFVLMLFVAWVFCLSLKKELVDLGVGILLITAMWFRINLVVNRDIKSWRISVLLIAMQVAVSLLSVNFIYRQRVLEWINILSNTEIVLIGGFDIIIMLDLMGEKEIFKKFSNFFLLLFKKKKKDSE